MKPLGKTISGTIAMLITAGGVAARVRGVLTREIAIWKKVVKAANIMVDG